MLFMTYCLTLLLHHPILVSVAEKLEWPDTRYTWQVANLDGRSVNGII